MDASYVGNKKKQSVKKKRVNTTAKPCYLLLMFKVDLPPSQQSVKYEFRQLMFIELV